MAAGPSRPTRLSDRTALPTQNDPERPDDGIAADRQVRDVEIVRDALDAEDVAATGPTLDAIRDWLPWVHAFSGIVAIAVAVA